MNAACKVMTQTTLRREHATVFNPGKHSLSGASLKVRKEDLVTCSTPDALASDTFDDTSRRWIALWKKEARRRQRERTAVVGASLRISID